MFHSVKVVAYSRIGANKIFVFCTDNGDGVIATGKWSNDIGNTGNGNAKADSDTKLVRNNTNAADIDDVRKDEGAASSSAVDRVPLRST
jgi:hypothetical protein